MNPFHKKQTPARLNKVEPTHYKWTFSDTAKDFWNNNQLLIGILIVLVCILILSMLISFAAATGHIHLISSEANVYEHLYQVI